MIATIFQAIAAGLILLALIALVVASVFYANVRRERAQWRICLSCQTFHNHAGGFSWTAPLGNGWYRVAECRDCRRAAVRLANEFSRAVCLAFLVFGCVSLRAGEIRVGQSSPLGLDASNFDSVGVVARPSGAFTHGEQRVSKQKRNAAAYVAGKTFPAPCNRIKAGQTFIRIPFAASQALILAVFALIAFGPRRNMGTPECKTSQTAVGQT